MFDFFHQPMDPSDIISPDQHLADFVDGIAPFGMYEPLEKRMVNLFKAYQDNEDRSVIY